jgi:opacity protein-like surface antigen
MKIMVLLAMLACLPMVVLAQSNFDDEVNTELDRLYEQNKARQTQQQQPVVQSQSLQQPGLGQPQIQVYKQPMTVIEAAPLSDSKAEKMRRARQETELMTEQKIVEKLEQSRMEDEKKRADVLFGEKFGQIENGTATAPAPVQAAVVVPEQKAEVDRDAVRQEISTALDELKAKEEKKSKSYFTAGAGLGDYGKTPNVRGNYSLGFAFGQQAANDRVQVEGVFNYANYSVEQRNWTSYGYSYYPRLTNMDTYQAAVAVKYLVLPGFFRPLLGATAAYSYRTFTDVQFGSAANDASSHAIDAGLIAGADVVFSESLTLGLEYKYMMNLTSRVQTNGPQPSYSQAFNNGDKPIEQLSYSNLLLSAKMSF